MSRRVLILASAADATAFGLGARLDRDDVVVVTPRDLARDGWRYRPGTAESTLALADGELSSRDLAGVITRLPAVSELELAHIVEPDRSYVAAELAAFLTAWLTDLPCAVANRPSAACLFGPFHRQEQWIRAAARAGLRVRSVRRRIAPGSLPWPDAGSTATVTVVGDRCFGDAGIEVQQAALALAASTGVTTLTATFTDAGPQGLLVAVSPWPRLELDEVADALLDHFSPCDALVGAR